MEERIEASEMNIFLTVLRYNSEEGGLCKRCSQDSCADTQMEINSKTTVTQGVGE